MGYSDDALNRPIVGITNTYSDYNPCHGNAPQIVEAVKRGVMLSGAMPMVFPTISIAESFSHPTSMYLRNLMAMDTEEMIRAQPMDAIIVIGGCDKTLPAQIMAAVSADLPTVVIPVGPMVVGHHKGEVLGACTDCRRLWGKYRAGEIDDVEIEAVNGRLAPSVGDSTTRSAERRGARRRRRSFHSGVCSGTVRPPGVQLRRSLRRERFPRGLLQFSPRIADLCRRPRHLQLCRADRARRGEPSATQRDAAVFPPDA